MEPNEQDQNKSDGGDKTDEKADKAAGDQGKDTKGAAASAGSGGSAAADGKSEDGTQKKDGTANAAGDALPIDQFDEADEANSGKTIQMTGAQLKDRLKRSAAQIEARFKREQEAAAAQAAAEAAERERQAEEKQLQEQQKFQELAEARLTRISELETERNTLKQQLEAAAPYEQAVKDVLNERRKLVPEAYRELLNDLPPLKQMDWIKRNEARLLQETGKVGAAGASGEDETKDNGAGNGQDKLSARRVPPSPQGDMLKGVPEAERKQVASEKKRELRRAF